MSVLSLMIQHAIEIIDKNDDAFPKWSTFVKVIGEYIASTPPSTAPIEAVPLDLLDPHLKQIGIDEPIYETFILYFTAANPFIEYDKK